VIGSIVGIVHRLLLFMRGGTLNFAVSSIVQAIPCINTERQCWLISRTPAKGSLPAPQAWQLAVNSQGEVVAATPVEGNEGGERTTLGLPTAQVPSNPAGDTLLVRGVLQPSGFWELSPWHGW
jgi:hypothetical protein